MIKNIFCFLLILGTMTNEIFSQKKSMTTIYGHFYTNSEEIESLNLIKLGVHSHLSYSAETETKINKNKTFKIELSIDTPSFYKVGDLWFGHRIFIEPGDSINITLKPIKGVEKKRENGEFVPKDYDLITSSKYYGNLTFYDELENLIQFTVKYKFEEPDIFKKRCSDTYTKCMNLLEAYKRKNAISEKFYVYAKEDIKARYLLWFCEMLSKKDKKNIPLNILKEFNDMEFNNLSMFCSSDKYSMASAVYNYYIASWYNPKSSTQNLVELFTNANKNYTGLIKDRVVGWLIKDFVGKNHPAFDSCYAVFLKECQSQRIKEEVVKKVKSYVPPNKKGDKLTLEEVLSRTKVDEYQKGNIGIKSILSDSLPTLIDCWASWCGPCKFQMPFVHEAEKRFEGKLKVVYLSFDEDEVKWMSHLEKSGHPTNQFLADNNFKSEMAKYFGIDVIPRYILISPKGEKVLNDKMPLPALTEEFDVELKKYLK